MSLVDAYHDSLESMLSSLTDEQRMGWDRQEIFVSPDLYAYPSSHCIDVVGEEDHLCVYHRASLVAVWIPAASLWVQRTDPTHAGYYELIDRIFHEYGVMV